MARPKRKFTLYKRETTKSKIIYYAKIREDEDEYRISTGQSSKASAELWVLDYLANKKKKAEEQANKRLNVLFRDYANGFWDYEGEYARSRRARLRSISFGYLDIRRGITSNHLIPQWGEFRLIELTTGQIDKWVLDQVSDNTVAPGSINQRLQTLKVMLDFACTEGLLKENPAQYVKPVADRYRRKGVLSKSEVRELLNPYIWKQYKHYAINLLTLSTGMRISEVRGLHVWQVHPDHVQVHTAWEEQHGLKEPKCGSVRDIPITSFVYSVIARTIEMTGATDLVFYGATKTTPLSKSAIENNLYSAMQQIGISEVDRRKRNLTFHSHRHTLNTMMRSAGIPDSKIRMLTGHREASMTERYTKFLLTDLTDIESVQMDLAESVRYSSIEHKI